MLPAEDRIRLQHMQEAASKAITYLGNKSQEEMANDEQLTIALTYLVQVIGEAANNVSDTTKEQTPGIPWRDMIGMRHVLVHTYFDINLDILWATVKRDLPPLHGTITRLLDGEG